MKIELKDLKFSEAQHRVNTVWFTSDGALYLRQIDREAHVI